MPLVDQYGRSVTSTVYEPSTYATNLALRELSKHILCDNDGVFGVNYKVAELRESCGVSRWGNKKKGDTVTIRKPTAYKVAGE